MSEQEANSVRHDHFGTKPASEFLTFVVEWKNSGDSARENDSCDEHDTSIIRVEKRAESDWNSFKRALSTRCGRSIGDRVIYVDSEGDEIPIESQCEFDEALRFASIRSTKSQSVNLIVERSSKLTLTDPKRDIETSRNTEKVSCQDKDAMPPMKLADEVQDYSRNQHSQPEINCNIEQPKRSDDTPPKWFTSYMQTMKDDIVDEVSKRVAQTVIEALQKKRDNQHDSATSRRRVSDSEYLLDSDVENNRSGRYSSISQDNEISSKRECEKRNSEGRLLIDEGFDDNSRRRRKTDKQQRKKYITKSASQQTLKTVDASSQRYSSLLNRRRNEKVSKKQPREEPRATMSSQSSRLNSPFPEDVFPSKNPKGSIDYTKVFDPHDRCINEETTKTLHETIAPILKLRLVNSCNDSEQNNDSKVHEDKNILGSRMGCSVTGNDVLERPNDRVPEYYALSDSDNISIISNVSHDSDIQRMSNSFDAMQRSLNPRDYFVDHENREFFITTESEHDDCERTNENRDNTRYSSSFELLSEPPSPPMSIHMDEDHFSTTCDNETNDYNINDDTTMKKPCNQSKIETCPMIDDPQQVKLYQRNIVDDGDGSIIDNCPEIILTKRTDGAYSFVSETLPGSSLMKAMTTNSNEESSTMTEDSGEAEPTLNFSKDHANSNDSFHESTQSFHSHTTTQINGERRDFTGYPSTSGHDEIPNVQRSNIFVDGNASKGLGDTKQSSPRKKSSTSSARNENFDPRRPKTGRRTSRTFGHYEGNYDSRHQAEHVSSIDEMVSDIAAVPIHILSENFVSGAAHVGRSAYSTAVRICEVILKTQTRKTADK